ncbi:MAG TPA: hypothetical protein VNA65_00345 [Candidatus Dormibacteraeota bacterium]|nr:hypothetical protein [Candidatus Dormibacteraeota bacterium]
MAQADSGVEANARLTSYVGLVLTVLLAVEFISGLAIRKSLSTHVLVGLLAVPPLALKLGSVGYRFVRYYAGEPRYRAAGAPALGMRLLAPLLVLLTAVVFISGLELWFFGYRFGVFWIPLHHGSAYLWFVIVAAHVINYMRRALNLTAADWKDHLQGALTRQSLVVASLILGAALIIGMLTFHSPFGFLAGES